MAMSPEIRRLCSAVAVVLVAFIGTPAVAQTGECNHVYYYVNLGDTYSGGDVIANIACVDSAGCSSIVYVQAGCNGCFDPTCTEGVSKFNTSAILGQVVSVDGANDFASGGISNGDLICSTGQLFVASRRQANLNQAHEWSRGSLAGTKFVYATNRGDTSTCEIFSFEGSSVNVSVGGVSQTPFDVGAFSVSSQGTFNARNSPLEFSSNNPIVVGCYEGTRDYTNVYPVHTGAIYGFDSKQTLGFNVDCTTLDTQLPGSVPACEDSGGATITPNVQGGNQYYTINANEANLYAGAGMACTPSSGHCIAVTTTADSDGSDGTMWVPDSHFASFFVLPFDSQRIAVVGEASTSSCQVLSGVGGTVLETLTMTGSSSTVNFAYSAALRSQGSVITCTGGDVAIIASFSSDEYNLGGRESESLWTYAAGLSTCAPTSNPTTSPSQTPTLLPTASPSSLPTQEPTASPTMLPSASPSLNPTTPEPTGEPTHSPSTSEPTSAPSSSATTEPTSGPSVSPSTSDPTSQPSVSPSTSEPTTSPSVQPTTSEPTSAGATNEPTVSPTTSSPTSSPSAATAAPTSSPSAATPEPTSSPSSGTPEPTSSPSPGTAEPTSSPSAVGGSSGPSISPTTAGPTNSPTTAVPSESPTTSTPSSSPTTSAPSESPTTSAPSVPTENPTLAPIEPTTLADDLTVVLAASLSSLALLLVAAGFIFFIARRRRKRKKEEEYEEELRKDRELREALQVQPVPMEKII